MNRRRSNSNLHQTQSEVVNLLVETTLKKHKIKPKRTLSSQEKTRLRNLFEQLQNEVNQFLQSIETGDNNETEQSASKKGKRRR